MKTFKYTILEQVRGEVTANDLPSAIVKMINQYYSKLKNPETLDFQYMHFTISEVK